jgi:DNA-directed RNA polymerase subunit RPC12/RpoP
MSERPILRLKNPPKLPPIERPPSSWKCKPCGTLFTTPEAGDAKGDVRCPACNAKLGPHADFAAYPPRDEKLRARLVKAPAKPAAPKRR